MRSSKLTLMSLTALCAMGGGSSAWAEEAVLYSTSGWVWAHDGSATAEYNAHSAYSWNSLGQQNRVKRTGTGAYRVTFPHLAISSSSLGNVHVVSYGTLPNFCKIAGFGSDNDGNAYADVLCFTRNAVTSDTPFVLTYSNLLLNTNKRFAAYLWNHKTAMPLGSLYEATSYGSYNSLGLKNGIRRLATGTYTVSVSGHGQSWDEVMQRFGTRYATVPATGTALVTAHGEGPTFCQIGGQRNDPTIGAIEVDVLCYQVNAQGESVPVDSQFTFSYGQTNPFFSRGHGQVTFGCWSKPEYAHLNVRGAVPASMGIHNMEYQRGSYGIAFSHLIAWNSSAAMVSANSSDGPRRCVITGWGGNGNGGTTVGVRCFDGRGGLVDSPCNLSYGTSQTH